MNLIYVLNAVSLILRYISVLLIVPCVCAVLLKEYLAIIPFLGTSIISFCFGFLFKAKNREKEEFNDLSRTDALAIVLLTWSMLFLLGSIPYTVGEEDKKSVKTAILQLLYEKYGITEKSFNFAR